MRPTKYTKELLESAQAYLTEYEVIEPVPTIAGLAIYLDVSRETVYAWAREEDKQEFSDIVSKLMTKQEFKLMAGGLEGKLNPTMTKLALTKHGYSDKQEQAITGANGAPLGVSITFHEPEGEDEQTSPTV